MIKDSTLDTLLFEQYLKPCDEDLKRLIRQANFDLYFGCYEEDYPGFKSAIEEIRQFADYLPSELYYDSNCGCLLDKLPEPEFDEELGEYIKPYLDDIYELDFKSIRSIVLGECANYL